MTARWTWTACLLSAWLGAGSITERGRVVSAEVVPHQHPYTHDILPASAPGAYDAHGVFLRSTLNPR